MFHDSHKKLAAILPYMHVWRRADAETGPLAISLVLSFSPMPHSSLPLLLPVENPSAEQICSMCLPILSAETLGSYKVSPSLLKSLLLVASCATAKNTELGQSRVQVLCHMALRLEALLSHSN